MKARPSSVCSVSAMLARVGIAIVVMASPVVLATELMAVGWQRGAAMLFQLALALASGLVIGVPRTRRVLGLFVALCGLGWAFCLPAQQTGTRGILALMSLLGLMRSLDLAVDGAGWDWKHRIWQVVGVVDIRELRRRDAPIFEATDLLLALAFFALASLYVTAAMFFGDLESSWFLPARWLCGAAAVYCVPECTQAAVRFTYKLLGFDIPPLHRHPILACSVREFWGERWNLVVHGWLRRHFFWPLARRRRATTGVVLAFVASAAIHFWFIYASVSFSMACAMGAFFMLQGLLVLVESRLGWSRRSRGAKARIWAILCVLIPSPLFVEPALRVFEGLSLEALLG